MFNKWKPWTQFFASLDIEDFDRMLGGSKGTIDVNEWRAQTDYRGYKEKCRQIKWFWKVKPNSLTHILLKLTRRFYLFQDSDFFYENGTYLSNVALMEIGDSSMQ